MLRMSVAYQCWEIGGGGGRPTVVYNKLAAHGPQQYVSDGSSFRRHHNCHESSCLSFFSTYVQGQNDAKAHHLAHPLDAAAVRLAAASSPSQLPEEQSLTFSATEVPAVSEAQAAGSSVTTEGEVHELQPGEGSAAGMPSSPPQQTGNSPKLHGVLLPDRGLRVKVQHKNSKPGVVKLPSRPVFSEHSVRPMDEGYANSAASSSSICNPSDDSSCTSEDDGLGDMEAQSVYRGPLDQMSALESSLPIKRPGLSKFFGGKSRSFSSLADVSSIADLAKPDNPYAKRRKMGFNCPLGRHRSYPPLSRPPSGGGGGIAKRLPSSGSRSTLAVAVKLGGLTEEQVECNALGVSSRSSENRTFPSRSYSLTDLAVAGSSRPPERALARP